MQVIGRFARTSVGITLLPRTQRVFLGSNIHSIRSTSVSTLVGASKRRLLSSSNAPSNEPQGMLARLMGVGAAGGFTGSLVGLGGGFVIVPLLVGVAKFTQHQATAASLASIAATSAVSAVSFGFNGAVDWAAVLLVTFPAMATVSMGARATAHVSGNTLKLLMGLFMIAISPLIPAKKYILEMLDNQPKSISASGKTESVSTSNERNISTTSSDKSVFPTNERIALATNNDTSESLPPTTQTSTTSTNQTSMTSTNDEEADTNNSNTELIYKTLMLAGIGAATGFSSGAFGVGGGTIMMIGLAACTDMTQHVLIGTSMAAMLLPSITGTVQHWKMGNLRPKAIIPLSAGTAIGALVGSHAALAAPEEPLKFLFGALMFTLGLRQARGAWLTRLPRKRV